MDFLSSNEYVMEMILSFMNLNEILNCGSVCKSWYHLTNRNSIWKYFCVKEEIQPEEWSWDLSSDEWKLGTPCEWKKCFMNFKKTMHNWQHNKSKRYLLEGTKVHSVVNDISTSDTLIIEKRAGLDVYKIRNGSIYFLQRLFQKDICINWVTFNDNYVIVRYDCGIIVYKLQNDKYKEDYFIYSEKGIMKCTTQETIVRKRYTLNDGRWCLFFRSPFYCLLGNILYFQFDSYCFPALHSNDARIVHAWHLQQRKYLLNIYCGNNNNYDKNYAYISNSEGTAISAYNRHCEVCFTVKINGIINKVNVNENMLIIFEGPRNYAVQSSKKFNLLFCNKHTGEIQLPSQKLVVNEGHISFGNFSDILFSLKSRQISACKIYNKSTIWQKPMPNFFDDLKMIYPRENGLMIILRDSDRLGQRQRNNRLRLSLDICDIKNGNCLYSIKLCQHAYVHSYKDLLITREGPSLLCVRLYR